MLLFLKRPCDRTAGGGPRAPGVAYAAPMLAVGGAVICGDLDAPRYILCRESLMEWSPVPWNNVPTPQNGGSRPAQPAAAAVGLGRIVIVRSHSFAL